MRKITMLLLFFATVVTYGQSFQFDVETGPVLIVNNAGTSIEFNDATNLANVPDNLYESFQITADWSAVGGGPFSSEARISMQTASGATAFLSPSSGGAGSTADTSLTFSGEFSGLYDPSVDGSLEVFFNQTWGGSSANWSNITVTIFEAPACLAPENLSATVLGTTDVELSWDAVSNATQYEWFIFETGADVDVDAPADSGLSGSNFTASANLNASTAYFFYVVADCGVDDGLSEASETVSFVTECDTFGDFSNDFSNEETNALPLCWTGNTVSTGTAPNLQVTTIGSPQFGTKQIRMQSSGDANTVHHLISPELNNLGTVDKRLRISARQLSATNANVLEVGVMSDPTDLTTFSVVETINFSGNVLADYDIILPEGTTENHFAFRATFSATFQTIYIDRVIYEDSPSCLEPSDLDETGFGLDFISIEWTGVVGVDDYEVAYGEDGFDPDTEGDVVLVEGQEVFTISDLDSGTLYDIYVRALCSDTDISNWSDVLTVLTLVEGANCEVALPISALPFTDSGNTSNFGNNLASADRPALDNAQFTEGTGSGNYLNGDDVVYSFTPANDGVFDFELNDIGTWVGFWLFEGCAPFTNTVAYSTLSTGADRLLPAISLQAGVTYYIVISTWPSPDSTPYELVVSELLCSSPTDLVVDGFTADSVEFSWEASIDAVEYNWFVFESSEDPEVDTPVASGTTDLTNASAADLSADTDYTIYVQSDCAGVESDFIQVSFFTGYCTPVSTGNFASDYIQLFETTGAVSDVNITASAVVPGAYRDLTDDVTLTVFAGQNFDFSTVYADGSGSNQVKVWADWDANLTFDEPEEVLFQLHAAGAAKSGSIEIPSDVANGSYRIRVRTQWIGTNSNGPDPCANITYGDTIDFTVEVTDAPSCFAPQGLVATNISTSEATISWTEVTNAVNYTWYVFEAGDNPELDTPVATGTTATTSALVEGLDAATSYQAYVETDCDTDGESDLSGAVTFATLCNSVDVFPYEYGFEGDGSLDTCWEANNLTGTGNWSVATVSVDGFQPNSGDYLAFLQWGSPVKTAELISAPLNLSSIGGAVEMSIFLHRHSGANAANDFYKIHINNSPSLTGATELFQLFSRNDIEPTVPSNGFYEYTIAIPEAFEASTEAYIIIEGSSQGWDIAVDDFSIYEAPEPTFANVQIIHNSPDPAAASVDIYIDGELDADLTGVMFRTATPFMNVPADTSYEIDIVPSGQPLSASVHNVTFTVEADENYIIVANGLLADFELTVYTGARLAAADASDVDVLVHHGSPDAPAVDVAVEGIGNVVTNIAFPEFEGYLSVAPTDIELQILPTGGDTPVAVYAAPLSGLQGAAVTVIASGLFGDGAVESNSFGLWVATATGGALIELPLVEDADAPMDPAPTPTEEEEFVISLFSNAYTDVAVDTWLTPWSLAQLEDIQIQGVDTKLYTNLDYAGVEMTGANSIDASEMLKFHVDFWTPNMTIVRVKLVDYGADNAFGGGDDTEHEVVFENLTIGEWNSLEIDLDDFEDLASTTNISQLIFSGLVDGVPGQGTLYVDNVYFSTISLSNSAFDSTNFTYYPNPVKHQLTIQSANTVEKVEIYNMLGQRVLLRKPNATNPSINMEDLTSGVYLMKVSINGVQKAFQVIKQ